MVQFLDIQTRYENTNFRRGELRNWYTERRETPIRALSIHHWAGEYIPGPESSIRAEMHEIDALAIDHFQRFGIGPGYHFVGFAPSERVYRVGGESTHRASVPYWNRETGHKWNEDILSLAIIGDWEGVEPTAGLDAIVSSWVYRMRSELPNGADLDVYGHREHELWHHFREEYVDNSTACPGSAIIEVLGRLGDGRDTVETYTVLEGDTLSEISMRFYGRPDRYPAILAASGYPPDFNPRVLPIGAVLNIPEIEDAVSVEQPDAPDAPEPDPDAPPTVDDRAAEIAAARVEGHAEGRADGLQQARSVLGEALRTLETA